jgi:hypothetical protein
MNTTTIADTLATLAANAAFNDELHCNYIAALRAAQLAGVAEPDAPSWEARKTDTMMINGCKVHAYFVASSGINRTKPKHWGSVRWYLNGKVVSRANLVKALEGAK